MQLQLKLRNRKHRIAQRLPPQPNFAYLSSFQNQNTVLLPKTSPHNHQQPTRATLDSAHLTVEEKAAGKTVDSTSTTPLL